MVSDVNPHPYIKEGNYPQAALFYTQTLELVPNHHVALANRSACFLKIGEHEKVGAEVQARPRLESAPRFQSLIVNRISVLSTS